MGAQVLVRTAEPGTERVGGSRDGQGGSRGSSLEDITGLLVCVGLSGAADLGLGRQRPHQGAVVRAPTQCMRLKAREF